MGVGVGVGRGVCWVSCHCRSSWLAYVIKVLALFFLFFCIPKVYIEYAVCVWECVCRCVGVWVCDCVCTCGNGITFNACTAHTSDNLSLV